MRPHPSQQRPIALTIAGSDSGGGAGIQADLKVFEALSVHGTSVITCLTAQNPNEVLGVQATPGSFVKQQLNAIFRQLPPQAAKTGMLFSAPIIKEVISWWRQHPTIPLVVDPVMISTSGKCLLKPDAVRILQDQLIPKATVVTPNLDEASFLLGRKIRNLDQLRDSAREAFERWGCAVLMKGGHLKGRRQATDVFYDGTEEILLEAPFIRGVHTHGTGCTYSAAIAALLARGTPLNDAVCHAKGFITEAIQNSYRIASHEALNPSGRS